MAILGKIAGSLSKDEREEVITELREDLSRIRLEFHDDDVNAAQRIKLTELKYDVLEAIYTLENTVSDADLKNERIALLERALFLLLEEVDRTNPELAKECRALMSK